MNLAGKTALVTGAARRIGRATAIALGEAGADVVVHYGRSEREANEVAAKLRAIGVRSDALGADLSIESATPQLVEEATKLTGRLDILVNSASIFEDALLEEVTFDQLHRNLDINALAPLFIVRAFYRHLKDRDADGVAVNFLDTRITDFDRKHVAYAVSKRASHSLTRMAAREFAPRLRVNAVAPGLVLPPEGEDESYLEQLRKTNPLQTSGTLAQVTDAVLFLVGNTFVTGQTIWVDGGRHLKGNFYGY